VTIARRVDGAVITADVPLAPSFAAPVARRAG
jgi:hypothetical protein